MIQEVPFKIFYAKNELLTSHHIFTIFWLYGLMVRITRCQRVGTGSIPVIAANNAS